MKDGQLLIIKFGWSVNIKLMQNEVCGIGWLGCDISWWDPCSVVRDSICISSIVVLSRVHQIEDLVLKSHKFILNKKLQDVVSHKAF